MAEDTAAATATAFEVNEAWTMSRNPSYEHTLCRFMAYVHNQQFELYPKGTTFSREQLIQIKPEHVHNWMAKLAFGKAEKPVTGLRKCAVSPSRWKKSN